MNGPNQSNEHDPITLPWPVFTRPAVDGFNPTRDNRLLEERAPLRGYGALAHSLWMERCVAFLSDDSAGLLSPEHYAEFGAPYTDRMFERFGGGFLHFHTMAYHQMDNLSAMERLTMYNWRPDPNTPEPGEILERLLPGARRKIVMLHLTLQQVREKIDLLAQGRFLVWVRCRDRREQEEIIRLVRDDAPIVERAAR